VDQIAVQPAGSTKGTRVRLFVRILTTFYRTFVTSALCPLKTHTYCANHPRRRPERDSIPIGPVFTGDPTGAREVWQSSPDTDEVRNHLLSLLTEVAEQSESEYPIGVYTDEVVVWQLGEFRETKAIPQLQRLASFDPAASETGPFGRTRSILVSLAEEALVKIEGGRT